MTTVRRLSLKILRTVNRFASPGAQDWAQAMLREMDFIEDDWTALLWTLGSTRVLLKPRDVPIADISDIPRAARSFTTKIRRRTRAGIVATSIQSALFGSFIFIYPNRIQRIGSDLVVVAMAYIACQLYKARPGEILIETLSSSRIASFRMELERQRDFHSGVRLWSRLVLFVPGPILWCIGFSTAHPEIARLNYWIAGFTIVVLIVAAPLNLREARNYQRQINALDAVCREPQ